MPRSRTSGEAHAEEPHFSFDDAPSEDSVESAQVSKQASGADAAMAVTKPGESQIRGSFMPGGGAGEDASTEFDQETHAQFGTGATAEEREAAIKEQRSKAQEKYEADVADPDVPLVPLPPGAEASPSAPTRG